jgi:DNA gyrase/topoisomerase IV subunit A
VRSFPILFADPNAAKQTSLPGAGAAAQLKQGEALKQGDSVVVVTKQGVGFGLQLTDLSATKKTGRRAVKIREGDALAAVTSLDKKLALFTEGASGLVINGSDIPVRDAAAVGVSLMGVRDDDRLVAAIGYSGNVTFKVSTDGGKVKEVPSKEITSGHRALKGTKVIARGSIEKVEKAS